MNSNFTTFYPFLFRQILHLVTQNDINRHGTQNPGEKRQNLKKYKNPQQQNNCHEGISPVLFFKTHFITI